MKKLRKSVSSLKLNNEAKAATLMIATITIIGVDAVQQNSAILRIETSLQLHDYIAFNDFWVINVLVINVGTLVCSILDERLYLSFANIFANELLHTVKY